MMNPSTCLLIANLLLASIGTAFAIGTTDVIEAGGKLDTFTDRALPPERRPALKRHQ